MNHEQYNDRVDISNEGRILAGGQGRTPQNVHDNGAAIFGMICAASGAIAGVLLYIAFLWLINATR